MDTQKKRVHFLGIGGSGASAIAAIAQAQGFEVTGCDKVINNEFTKVFNSNQLFEGHSPNHLLCHPERVSGSNDKIPNQVRNDTYVNILAVTPAIFSQDPN